MKNLKKILLTICLSILIFSCGYEPMFKNLKNLNFIITLNEASGNENINRLIKFKLKNYSKKKDGLANYTINYFTDYKKLILAKDTKGNATEYTIKIDVRFTVLSGDLKKEYNYTESFNMKSNSDILEEKDYEKTIQNSLVNIITRKLILQLSQIQ